MLEFQALLVLGGLSSQKVIQKLEMAISNIKAERIYLRPERANFRILCTAVWNTDSDEKNVTVLVWWHVHNQRTNVKKIFH